MQQCDAHCIGRAAVLIVGRCHWCAQAAWTRPSVFGKAGCMSSSFWWNERDFDQVILMDYPAPPAGEVFYLDSGDCCPTPSGDDRFVCACTSSKKLDVCRVQRFSPIVHYH
jgi:hypothetical protein